MNFKQQYKKLEQDVHQKLRELIEQSNYNSKFMSNHKAIRITGIEINLSNIEELAIVNDQLTFLNDNGYHYSIYNFSLEELIEISNYKLE